MGPAGLRVGGDRDGAASKGFVTAPLQRDSLSSTCTADPWQVPGRGQPD